MPSDTNPATAQVAARHTRFSGRPSGKRKSSTTMAPIVSAGVGSESVSTSDAPGNEAGAVYVARTTYSVPVIPEIRKKPMAKQTHPIALDGVRRTMAVPTTLYAIAVRPKSASSPAALSSGASARFAAMRTIPASRNNAITASHAYARRRAVPGAEPGTAHGAFCSLGPARRKVGLPRVPTLGTSPASGCWHPPEPWWGPGRFRWSRALR